MTCRVMPSRLVDVQLCDTGISLYETADGRAGPTCAAHGGGTRKGPGEVAGALLLLRAVRRLSASRSTTLTSLAPMLGGDVGEHTGRDGGVDGEHDERLAALGVARDLHAGDVDAGVAEQAADGADDAGAVGVARRTRMCSASGTSRSKPLTPTSFSTSAARSGCPRR